MWWDGMVWYGRFTMVLSLFHKVISIKDLFCRVGFKSWIGMDRHTMPLM